MSFESLNLPDADVLLMPELGMSLGSDRLFELLHGETSWRHQEVVVYGKRHRQPRLTAWYGDACARYAYAGAAMDPLPWTELLIELTQAVEAVTQARFNSVLLNLYRDHHDRIGFHSDNEQSLGSNPTIASLSYGATRTLKLRHKRRPDLGTRKVPLTHGSLLLMRGGTQESWRHNIDRQAQPCGRRINLTFRRVSG